MAKHSPLRHDLREEVIERILNGELRAGQKVNETRLAKDLRVSRTPVRETLLSLGKEGFVRSDRGRGFYLEPISGREVREIYPIIAALECLAIRNAQPFLPLAIPELKRINTLLKKAKAALNRSLALDARWHEVLITQCRNQRLLTIHADLRLAIRRYERLYMNQPRLVDVSVGHHQSIIAALEKEKIELAVKALEENWRFTMEFLLLRLNEP
jgi:DNA-binding GntR family transcriptional regulator